MKYYFAPLEGITWYIYRNAHHQFFPGVDKYFAPSSRSDERTPWENITVKEYFKTLKNKNNGM